MARRWMLRLLFITLLLVVAGMLVSNYLMSSRYAYRQVKGIAPARDNYLLSINGHISRTQRPEETFDFPIELGETGPVLSLYSGPPQYPFYCMTLDSDLGQPLVDNQQGLGVPVYRDIEQQADIAGYSKDCSLRTTLSYYYINTSNKWVEADAEQMASLTPQERTSVPWFRVERGTINRYIYMIVMPVRLEEIGDRLASSAWNGRLIYQFHGGSGIGFRQGRLKVSQVAKPLQRQLLDGYAVISSSGNKTSYHYNMLLAEDTARRVKRQFVSLYGEPLYTVGVGGSGGALAQYLIAQNSTGILDGLLPLYSYPDMVTQATYALDCDLLNNYFTFRAADRERWNDWSERRLIEGMNAANGIEQRAAFLQPLNQLVAGIAPSLPKGNSECIHGWFGLSSYINNPRQGFLVDYFHPSLVEKVNWSYWQDMVWIYGRDSHQMARTTWDNQGVQYGLEALKNGRLSAEEFLDLNRNIGSWKKQYRMKPEVLFTPLGFKLPLWLSLWSRGNITEVDEESGVASRYAGSVDAMRAAYRSGQVFIGRVALPVIDVRHYLEHKLDMHHVSASFYTRLRLIDANGHADNQVIWVADKHFYPVDAAFEMMDRWLTALAENPRLSVREAKPENLADACFDRHGEIIHSGADVWDGAWNGRPAGSCNEFYPMFSNSRIEAGGTWAGDTLKCQLIPVGAAWEQGIYGAAIDRDALGELAQVFPDGVCDYSLPDLGRPADL
jgi:hypothetical protein